MPTTGNFIRTAKRSISVRVVECHETRRKPTVTGLSDDFVDAGPLGSLKVNEKAATMLGEDQRLQTEGCSAQGGYRSISELRGIPTCRYHQLWPASRVGK